MISISNFCIDCKYYTNEFKKEPCKSCQEKEPTNFIDKDLKTYMERNKLKV